MIPPVVDPGWLRERRAGVVLADVRWYLDGRSGLEAYRRGHLPGAVFVDLDRWLAGDASPKAGRHPLPHPEVFAEGMADAGIADDTVVVAYDDAGGVIAARLVWMLRVTGHDAALLDGGLDPHIPPEALEQGSPALPRARLGARFGARPWPAQALAGIDDAGDPANVVLDARQRERYRGDPDPIDPRSGHIPGARSLPCRENLASDGRLLPVEELRQRFRSVGAGDGTRVVSYCGSGVTACHNLLALEYAGLGRGRLYPGSWSQYAHAAHRPVETGDPPGGEPQTGEPPPPHH